MLKKKSKAKLRTIGRKDKADFPDLGLQDVNVKVDTGAYTSALHAEVLGEEEIDGALHVRFRLKHPRFRKKFDGREFILPVVRKKLIKSSSGRGQERYIIRTHIELFGESVFTEFSLADRRKLENPVLLGRRLLSLGFRVDTTRTDLSYKSKRKQAKKKS